MLDRYLGVNTSSWGKVPEEQNQVEVRKEEVLGQTDQPKKQGSNPELCSANSTYISPPLGVTNICRSWRAGSTSANQHWPQHCSGDTAELMAVSSTTVWWCSFSGSEEAELGRGREEWVQEGEAVAASTAVSCAPPWARQPNTGLFNSALTQ